MQIPVRHLAGNVVWTRQGTVWAIWRVESEGQAHASAKARLDRMRAMESLVKRLHGESMWLSLCPQVDPYAVVRQMTEDVDLDASPRYEALAHRVLEELELLELTARTDWLAVPLPTTNWRRAAKEMTAAARSEMALQLGLMPAPVRVREEERRLKQAEELSAGWPASVRVRAASEAEILWIYGHAARRGVLEPLLPQADGPRAVRGRGRGVAALEQAVLVQGGVETNQAQDGAEAEEADVPASFRRRWLQVSTPWGTSYQSTLMLSEMPERFVFPGSEYLERLDDFAFPVDWVMRLQVTPGKQAERKARRKSRDVAGQAEEYGQDAAGAPAQVEKAPSDLAEYRDRLTAGSSEVEVRAMVALCVWGATPGEVESRAGEVEGWFDDNEYALARPVGEQERLWHGMLPGARIPPAMLAYRQFFLAQDFAMAGPFTGSAWGDERGPLYALQMTGGGVRPALVDFARGPRKKTSASAAFIGEKGGGKSFAMKTAGFQTLLTGHRRRRPRSRARLVAVDRTRHGEWVEFAKACPGTVQTVTVDTDAQVSLDPLRILTRPRRDGLGLDWGAVQRRTESFLTLLLGIRPADDIADALSEAVEHVLAAPDPSMARLIAVLDGNAECDDDARVLARKLRKYARSDLGRMIFEPSLPALNTDADAVVFSVANLKLPSESELKNSELFTKLSAEKLFGRATLYLIAAICQHVAFEDTSEFSLVVLDECWWLTRSPEGKDLTLELLRDGRKNNAGLFLGSHDADDIGDDTEEGRILRGLIPRRHLFRQTNGILARRGLSFLGLDPADDDLVDLVTKRLSPVHADDAEQAARAGECLARDLFGRITQIKIVQPPDPELAKVIHSDPDDGVQDEAA
ncbi:AAA-like domain protein [Streptomyces sp. YIM 130001]|uniref:ATP-binding protein n=1 Tax=Streptomyces sp. YIM 130001 TaxID=2259644 RepID=UPI000E64DA2F|nr:ATP-binding protein [Streptomyces sp. YIM 130001]RII06954.1 AAA-like domain protein [Streptomyces sp. YIM 130001]